MIPAPRRLAFRAFACLAVLAPSLARAQEVVDPSAEGGTTSSGSPVVGYIVAGIFTALALFIIGKSARR